MQKIITFFFILMLVSLPFAYSGGWFSSTENTLEECTDNIDNDGDGYIDRADDSCYGLVTGWITLKDNDSYTPYMPITFIPDIGSVSYNQTDESGYYETFIWPGTYQIFASNGTHRSDTIYGQEIDSLGVYSIDMEVSKFENRCEADCTYVDDDICHKECEGLNPNCRSPADAAFDVVSECDGYKKDYIITHEDGGTTYDVKCCSGQPYEKSPVQYDESIVKNVNGETQSLLILKRVVILDGVPVQLNIITYR